ncbi:MAG: hypothetical protein ACP5NC_02025 [Nitrososphaeria archaeon]
MKKYIKLVASLVISFSPPLGMNRGFINERFNKILNDSNIVDRYFDGKLTKELFEAYTKFSYRQLLNGVVSITKQGYPVYLAISGLFLENAGKYSPELLNQLKDASNSGKLMIANTTLYGGLYPLCKNSVEEMAEQLRMNNAIIGKFGLKASEIVVMPFLIFNEQVEKAAKASGATTVITEEMDGFSNHKFVYGTQSSDLRVVIRNRKASEAAYEGMFEGLSDVDGVIYLEAEQLINRGEKFVNVLINYISKGGIALGNMGDSTSPVTTGTLFVPENMALYDLAYGNDLLKMDFAQRTIFDKTCKLLDYTRMLGDTKLVQVWRLLMQADNYLCMSGSHYRRLKIIAEPDEAKLLNTYVLADFEGKVANTYIRKKSQAAVSH